MEWNKTALDSQLIRDFGDRYGTDLLTSAILLRRGIDEPRQMRFFLEHKHTNLHNPFLFVEMEEAVDRINAAIDTSEGIFVFGDRDVDGITSTVLLVESLRSLGATVKWALPEGDAVYGLSPEVIDAVAESGSGLLITVDCGISNSREVELAAEHGIDVVIVDHHNAQGDLPVPIALIDPKIEDCGYPFRDLSACGVAFKLQWALRFSRTPFYGKPLHALNIKPLNDAFLLETARIENLVVTEICRENLVSGIVPFESTKTASFLSGSDVLVYDSELQTKLLGDIFEKEPQLSLEDLQPMLAADEPAFSGKSLVRIIEEYSIYQDDGYDELDLLTDLVCQTIHNHDSLRSEVERYDLVALATLADIMPLIDENRLLVRLGLAQLNESPHKPLRELCMRNGLVGKRIRTRDVAWNLSPVINSTGRLGEPGKAAALLMAHDDGEIRELSDSVMEMNRRRKKMGQDTWDKILKRAQESFEKTEGKFVFVADAVVHRGITGLMASRLVSYFKTPAVVVSLANHRVTGSVRSVQSFKLMGFLGKFGELFLDFGGHDFAGGFTMEKDKFETFQDMFYEVVNQLPVNSPVEDGSFTVDAEIPLSYLTPDLWKIVEFFEPYGEGNSKLVFMSKGLTVTSCDLMGRPTPVHVKLLLDTGSLKWPAVFWQASERVGKDFNVEDTVDILYSVVENRNTYQLVIIDIKRCS